MFTGLVRDVGTVVALAPREVPPGASQGFPVGACTDAGAIRIVLETRLEARDLVIGASVACNGVCLTVVPLSAHEKNVNEDLGTSRFAVEAGPETLAVTGLGALVIGALVNLEPALRVGDPLGGHNVTGHVDTLARVQAFEPWEGGFWKLTLALPSSSLNFVIPKGSIAIAGVSLTIARIPLTETAPTAPDPTAVPVLCEFMLIPHTMEQTNLRMLREGAMVEIEFDPFVKTLNVLLSRFLQNRSDVGQLVKR